MRPKGRGSARRHPGRAVVLILLTSALCIGAAVAQVAVGDPCVLYGSMSTSKETRLFTVNLRQDSTQLLGAPTPGTYITGLAVHPVSGEVYGLLVDRVRYGNTLLARVDALTGELTEIGRAEPAWLTALGFRPTDATLWAWSRRLGLVRIDPATGVMNLVVPEPDLAVAAVAWNPEGDLLYLAVNSPLAIGSELWVYEDGPGELRRIDGMLPVEVGGLAMRADGQLLLTSARVDVGAQSRELVVFDPATRTVSATLHAKLVPGEMIAVRRVGQVDALTWPLACGNPSPGGRVELIQSVEIDKSEVCPGEAIHIQVDAVHPEGGNNSVLVSIDGVTGAERTLEFEGQPGPRMIKVSAGTPEGYMDGETLTLDVLDCPGALVPHLYVAMNPFHPYTVDFFVPDADEIAAPGTLYEWDFGDGAMENTEVPFVSHSYEDVLQPEQEYSNFQASVTLHLPDGATLNAPESVALWNAYAANRQLGLIRPPTDYSPEPVRSGSRTTGEYTLRNIEPGPITLTGRQIRQQPCDPAEDPVALPWEALTVTLGPGEELTQTVDLDAPEEICGVSVHIAGEAGLTRRVGADFYFELKENPLFKQPVTDQPTLAMLNDVAALGLVSDPDYITDEDLYRLSHEGRTVIPDSTSRAAASPRSRARQSTETADRCTPGDAPPAENLSCQATEEFERMPPHLPNALKGDVVLVGGCGLVGQMLQEVTPPQKFVHVGIMTENYVEIAHSTASEQRYEDTNNMTPPCLFGECGIPPDGHMRYDVLRYGWPGIIREDVATAFSRKWLTDPSELVSLGPLLQKRGDTYHLKDFTSEPARCNGTFAVPWIVKPPPTADPSVRETLHQAANEAAGIAARVDHGFAPTEPAVELSCDDGLDNDCDGFVDASDTSQLPFLIGGDPDCDNCTATEDVEHSCSDMTDNDCDGFYDEHDPDCNGCADTQNPADHLEICGDGLDNDCDGFYDDDDPDCNHCVNPTDEVCGDGVDNDCDGFYDDTDPDCSGCTQTQDTEEACDDGLDNDCDGFADDDDPDCNGCVETQNPADHVEICDDEVDNDCDGFFDRDDIDCGGCSGAGGGHYRFYGYTNAQIAFDPDYNDPRGGPATVCSTFVWQALKKAGATLEGAVLEQRDSALGAEVEMSYIPDCSGGTDPTTGEVECNDGLYLYDEEERRNAADSLWGLVHNSVWFAATPILQDTVCWAADGLANQVVNAFAADVVTNYIHHPIPIGYHQKTPTLNEPGSGLTVSPDDILFWDPPPVGVYGYGERLVYRSGGWKRVYRWAPSQGTGVVRGSVIYEGSPMARATVSIPDAPGSPTTVSKENGKFKLVAPEGAWEIKAWKQLPEPPQAPTVACGEASVPVCDGECEDVDLVCQESASDSCECLPPQLYLEAYECDEQACPRPYEIDVVSGKTSSIELELKLPSDRYREVNLDDSWLSVRDEDWDGCFWNPSCYRRYTSLEDCGQGLSCYVDPTNPYAEVHWLCSSCDAHDGNPAEVFIDMTCTFLGDDPDDEEYGSVWVVLIVRLGSDVGLHWFTIAPDMEYTRPTGDWMWAGTPLISLSAAQGASGCVGHVYDEAKFWLKARNTVPY